VAAAGYVTVADFLLSLPFRYEDRRHFVPVAGLTWGTPATVLVRFSGIRSTRMRRGTMRVEAVADDGTGAVRVVWHNRYPSWAKSLEGRRAALYGAPEPGSKGEMRLENPETELFDEAEASDPVHTGRIVGVYHRVHTGLAVIPVQPLALLFLANHAREALSGEQHLERRPVRISLNLRAARPGL